MDFVSLLGTLSRSSAQAVSTLAKASPEIEAFKAYLYVKTPIEKKFVDLLEDHRASKQTIFLCGSSGDGKSELLRRHHVNFMDDYLFHLDATHSFKPDQNAIQALDELFDSHTESTKPLVIGINIGMMFNYLNAGAERHQAVKDAIAKFIDGDREIGSFSFVSFEDYPKFSLSEGEVGSPFVKQLLEKVTAPVEENPLYNAYLKDFETNNRVEYQNYRILQENSVQELIIQLLLQARLKYDQFLSSRSLLDFVYHLLAGGQSIFDNLFNTHATGLAASLVTFDPCLIRSKNIDEFVVQQSISVRDQRFENFKASFMEQYELEAGKYSSSTWIRTFFLLRRKEIGNNYHQSFSEDFKQPLFEEYIRIWQLHNSSEPDLKLLREFYKKSLIASLVKFANRLVSKIVKDGIFIAERNGVFISSKVDLKMDARRVNGAKMGKIHSFNAYLNLGNQEIQPFPITISFLELADRILDGYRPNRHDKNSVVILEEVVEEITCLAGQSHLLNFHKADLSAHWSLTLEDDELIVEELH